MTQAKSENSSGVLQTPAAVKAALPVEEPETDASQGPSEAKPAKPKKIKSAEEVRNSVHDLMTEVLKKHDLDIGRCGLGTSADRIESSLDKTTGFWKKSSVFNKPSRWIFHVVATSKGPKAIWPSQPTKDVMGVVSATDKKAVLTYRLVPLFKSAENKYVFDAAWEWLLWIALRHPLRKSLGNSAPVRGLNFQKQEFYVNGQRFPVLDAGLVGLCNPAMKLTVEGFEEPIEYGKITQELLEVLSKLGSVEQHQTEFITAVVAPVEGATE